MDHDHVIKVKHGNVMHRITYNKDTLRSTPLSINFAQLEQKIRDMFKFPKEVKISITYADIDGDVVTMSGEADLHDACVVQKLNPLRLSVQVNENEEVKVEPKAEAQGEAQEQPQEVPVKQLIDAIFRIIPAAPAPVEQLKDAVLKGFVSPLAFTELLEALLNPEHPRPSEAPSEAQPNTSSSENVTPTEVPKSQVAEETSGPRVSTNCGRNSERVFHHHVQCDGCGLSPIVGPRFKSIKKEDYDLCLNCYNEIGKEGEYVRYDQPVQRYYRHPGHPFGGHRSLYGRSASCPYGRHLGNLSRSFGRSCPGGGAGAGAGPGAGTGAGSPCVGGPAAFVPGRSYAFNTKLGGRFVADVTIFDGTELSPCTPFVKIWRLRNSGNVPWEQNTQLVRVGGDDLGTVSSVTLELPLGGLAPEAELDVSVDLISPEKPGRYVSYWRLMSPYGQKFGHRVWALIQVVPKVDQEEEDATVKVETSNVDIAGKEEGRELAKDMSEVKETLTKPEEVAYAETKVDELADAAVLVDIKGIETENQEGIQVAAVAQPVEELNVDTDTVVFFEAKSLDTENSTMENSELGGFSMVEMPVGSALPDRQTVPSAPFKMVSTDASTVTATNGDVVSDLIVQLEAMGFTDNMLNLELLEKNNLDLSLTLDDLVSSTEWDPLLEELEEMGFYDTAMNRRLMFKNNGSVKRVVKELVQMYKDRSVKVKEA